MAISISHVTYQYRDGSVAGQSALEDLTIDLVAEGKMTALLGAPGSGKSTLLQHLNGLLLPDHGLLHVYDYLIKPGMKKVPAGLRRKVGLVFQYPEQQLFATTVEEDLSFGPRNFGFTEEEIRAAADRAAKLMGLDESLLQKIPFELSSGQMRKAAIAAVLAADPDLLVLDEPTASLDPASRDELMRLLQTLCREHRKTVVIVTHRLEEVISYADEFLVIDQGRLIFQGDGETLVGEPDVLGAAGLILPESIRMANAISERFDVPLPGLLLDAGELASWIVQCLGKEGGSG